MRRFRCHRCGVELFFDNDRCTNCGGNVRYVPERDDLVTYEDALPDKLHECSIGVEHGICNWTTPAEGTPCASCALTVTRPDLTVPGVMEYWRHFELAKRRVLRQIWGYGIPTDAPEPPADGSPPGPGEVGLTFELLASAPGTPVTIGHADGLVSLDVTEADPETRERERAELGEPYRTPLGHVRHEVGHYVWARMIDGTDQLESFRKLFGDEREDYQEALRTHYAGTDDGSWQKDHISFYASAHPWEDFAETFAHALHMHDTMDTARAFGLTGRRQPRKWADRYAQWVELEVALNSLNRAMGHDDAYPFVLPEPAVDKLRYVEEIILES
ncbi:MAG: putative zinc-binding metallopeptidase [Actinomycetota bacterium]|nr:putative zinc-binding metallopeptidase [Actinomycetota bacterium]